MGIQFNGDVTVNGNVEMYNNGSMRIVSNQDTVDITKLNEYIERNLEYSPDKAEYLQAADVLKNSEDKGKLQAALLKLRSLSYELGKSLMISGLSSVAQSVIRNILGS